MEPRFFATPAEWRRWLARHHASVPELWVGFHRKATGRPSITWPEAVDEALAYGWIDGLRRRLDEDRYVIRFTPRRPGSIWSAVNLRRVAELTKQGRMQPAGLAAHAKAKHARSGIYSYEQRKKAELPPPLEGRFRENRGAWAFFQSQPPSYRHTATWWVISAKRDDTRERRFVTLVEDSAAGRRLKHLARS